ncbi:MAG: EamA family transporter [Opitutales bacterium]
MIYLLLTSLIWAFSFGLIGNVLKGLDPLLVAGARLFIALLVLLPLLRPRRLSGNDRLYLLAIGAVQFGLMYSAYLSAFRFVPSHMVALFSVLTPLYVVLIHDLRQGRFTPVYLLAALLSVAGAATIKARGGETGSLWAGFGLMQISGIAFAYGQVAYRDWVQAKKMQSIGSAFKDSDGFAYLYAGGAVTALLASFLLSPTPTQLLAASPAQMGVILYLGVVASGLGFFLWNKGASLSSPGALAACNNALVPMAIFVSLFIFGEIRDASANELIRFGIGATLIGSAVELGKRHHQAGEGPLS